MKPIPYVPLPLIPLKLPPVQPTKAEVDLKRILVHDNRTHLKRMFG